MARTYNDWNYVVVWEFRVRAGREEEFEDAYGPAGRWTGFFRLSQAYVRTELSRDQNDRQRYVSFDFWVSHKAYDDFCQQHRREYEEIDRECERLTASEKKVGAFDRIA